MSAIRITAATANPAKLREIQRVVGDVAIVVPLPLDAADLAYAALSCEPGDSIEEIAVAKATGWSRALWQRGLGSLTIATDGGLLIPALGEVWDPRLTRRFAGDAASDLERSQRLLALCADLSGPERKIAWFEAVAIADRGTLVGVWSASGRPGRLATTIRPDLLERNPGFWVPALWEVPDLNHRLLAELDDTERERLGDHWTSLREPVRLGLEQYLRARDLTTSAPGSSDQEM